MGCCKALTTAGIILLVAVFIILMTESLITLNYFEYGFVRWRSTGAVDTSRVYTGGNYFVAPDAAFKTYPRHAQFKQFTQKAIFTSDRLEVWISLSFQYVLREEGLAALHKQYDIYYEPVLEKNAQDALKNAATVFSTREYLEERALVEQHLKNAVTERLGGKCCGVRDCSKAYCIPGCIPYDTCKESDMGLFTIVKYFQLQDFRIPDDVQGRFMKSLTLQEESRTEKYKQEATVVKKLTYQIAENIRNEAREINRNATTYAALITSLSEANATAQIERARATGLQQMYAKLGLEDEAHKASFDYLKSVRDMDNAHLSVNFDNVFLEIQSKS